MYVDDVRKKKILSELLVQQSISKESVRVGCVITDKDDNIILSGYNGRYIHFLGIKEHAEVNAINQISNHYDLTGHTMYITLEPCLECLSYAIKRGIKNFVFLKHWYKHKDDYKAKVYQLMTNTDITIKRWNIDGNGRSI